MTQQTQEWAVPMRKEALGPVGNPDSPWWGVAGAGLGGLAGAAMTRSWWGPVLGILVGWMLGGKAPTWWNTWWQENNITPRNPRTGETIQPQQPDVNPEGVNPTVEGVRNPDTASIAAVNTDRQQLEEEGVQEQLRQAQEEALAQQQSVPEVVSPDQWEQQMIEEADMSRMNQILEQQEQARQQAALQPRTVRMSDVPPQFRPNQPAADPVIPSQQAEQAAFQRFREPTPRELQNMYMPQEVEAFTAQQGPLYFSTNPQRDMYQQSAMQQMRGALAAEQRRSDQAQYQNKQQLQRPDFMWNQMQGATQSAERQTSLPRAFQSSMFSSEQLPWNQTQRRIEDRNTQQDLISNSPADAVRNRNRNLIGGR